MHRTRGNIFPYIPSDGTSWSGPPQVHPPDICFRDFEKVLLKARPTVSKDDLTVPLPRMLLALPTERSCLHIPSARLCPAV